jgi:hypothetical protein
MNKATASSIDQIVFHVLKAAIANFAQNLNGCAKTIPTLLAIPHAW